MKLTRTHLAGLASLVFIIVLVILYTAGADSETAKDFAERIEGMLALTSVAFIGEIAKGRVAK